MRSVIKIALTGFVMLASAAANAQYINGTMTLSGDYVANMTISGNLSTVTDVTLSTVTTAGTATVDFGTTIGFSAPSPPPDGANTAANPFGTADLATTPFVPVSNFFTYAGWQLDLTTLIIDSNTTPGFLHLSGSGMVSGNGYQNTDATWSFSANNSKTYSMNVTAVPAVPVPAAVWLFGSGLIGLAGIARRKVS
jgi:hypothetical protein